MATTKIIDNQAQRLIDQENENELYRKYLQKQKLKPFE